MTDDDRQMLGRADPARSLAPLDATALNELLEDTMGQNEDTNPDGRRKVVLLGAAAAAVVAIAIGVGITLDDDGEPPETGDRPDVTSSTVTELSARPALGKCMVPSPETAANQDVAFEGRVVSVKDGLVTLDPTRFYTGRATDRVTVNEPDLNMSELPVDFQVGQNYIVGATDGNVSICGLSGPSSEELRALYDAAFPR